MRMIRWMCNRFTCSELRQTLGIGDIITVIQRHRLRWYGHVLRKNENEGVKKCTDFEVKRQVKETVE